MLSRPWIRLCLIAGILLLVNMSPRLCCPDDDLAIISNNKIAIAFTKGTGAIVSVVNRAKGLSLLANDGEERLPFMIDTESKNPPQVQRFSCGGAQDESGNQSLLLTWECCGDIIVRVTCKLAHDGQMILMIPEVINGGSAAIRRFTFPILGKLAPLGDSAEDDILAHGFSRGLIVRNPAKTLNVKNNPLKSAQYPQSYSGMSHQLIDYYSEGVGGFFFAAFDPHATEKHVRMPLDDDSLTMRWVSTNWNQTPGVGMDFGFPFVIGANNTGDWREAADIYREWALTTDWCKDGPNYLKSDDEKCRWLLEETGLTTFGVSSREDKSDVFQGYHDLIGAPIFHITGHDFREYPFGDSTRDVFEPMVHPNNIETFKRNGDRWAPFFFDQKAAFLSREMRERLCKTPLNEKWYKNQFCPTLAYWRSLHAHRDVFVQNSLDCDASYYDASAPNRSLNCNNKNHPHPPGAGRWINEGYRELYKNTRIALSEAAGRYIPIGVELMHEGLIDSYDYYQARSSGGFMGFLEGGYYRGEKISGMVEAAPIFGYIYHDYAPVAMDGCGKVSEKIGDIFYWMAARTLLWGELFQLNCEYSPSERFPGMTKVGQIHFHRPYDWLDVDHPVNSPVDPKKGEFLREMHEARTGFAKDFLAYGRMLPPIDLDCGKVALDYNYYQNLGWGGKPNSLQYADQKGTWDAPRVLHAAWKFEDRLGLLFVNLGEEEYTAEIDLGLSRYEKYGLEFGADVEIKRYGTNGTDETYENIGDSLELSLPSRKIVLLEAEDKTPAIVIGARSQREYRTHN